MVYDLERNKKLKILISKLLLINILIVPFYTHSFFSVLRILLFSIIFLLFILDFHKNGFFKKEIKYIFILIFTFFVAIILHKADIILREVIYLRKYIFYPFFLYILYYLYGKYLGTQKVLSYVVLSILISTVLGFIVYIQEFSLFNWGVNRFSGLYLDPNFYGLHTLIAIIICVEKYKRKREKYLIFFLLIFFMGLILSISKTAIVILLIYFFSLIRFSIKNITKSVICILFLFAFLSTNYEMVTPIFERFKNIFQLSELDLKVISVTSGINYQPGTILGVPMDSFSNRVGLWVISLNIYLNNLTSGVGLGEMLNSYMKFYVDGVIPIPSHSHNTYFQILVEFGSIGLLLMTLVYKNLSNNNDAILIKIKPYLFLYIFTITAYAMPLLYILLAIMSINNFIRK